MTESEANELRCFAHEVIIKLFDAKQSTHLDLLMVHCQRAIEEIKRPAPTDATTGGVKHKGATNG